MSGELPNWVYDVVIELERWHEEHPKLMAEYYPDYQPTPVDDCGCRALDLVPEQVREQAKAIRAYVSDADHQRERMGVPVFTSDDTAEDVR